MQSVGQWVTRGTFVSHAHILGEAKIQMPLLEMGTDRILPLHNFKNFEVRLNALGSDKPALSIYTDAMVQKWTVDLELGFTLAN